MDQLLENFDLLYKASQDPENVLENDERTLEEKAVFFQKKCVNIIHSSEELMRMNTVLVTNLNTILPAQANDDERLIVNEAELGQNIISSPSRSADDPISIQRKIVLVLSKIRRFYPLEFKKALAQIPNNPNEVEVPQEEDLIAPLKPFVTRTHEHFWFLPSNMNQTGLSCPRDFTDIHVICGFLQQNLGQMAASRLLYSFLSLAPTFFLNFQGQGYLLPLLLSVKFCITTRRAWDVPPVTLDGLESLPNDLKRQVLQRVNPFPVVSDTFVDFVNETGNAAISPNEHSPLNHLLNELNGVQPQEFPNRFSLLVKEKHMRSVDKILFLIERLN